MAIKTFTTGEVLTASDTNTYLANSGLVYVGGGPLATATTNFQGCFTSTYRNYRVVIDSYSVSAGSWSYLRYLSGATPNATANYSSAGSGLSSNGSTNTRTANSTAGYLTYTDTAALATSMQFDISTPFLSQRTFLQGTAMSYQAAFAWSSPNFFIEQNQITIFDGFQIISLGAPTLTGNVAIYGYRVAW